MARSVGGILAAVVIGGGFVGYKFYSKNQIGHEALEQAHKLCATMPSYSANQTYVDTLCDQHHEQAFDHCYSMGSRRTASSFNEGKYYQELFDGMIAQAGREGHKDVAAELSQLEQGVLSQFK